MNAISKNLVLAAFAAFAVPVVTQATVPTSATQNVPGTMNYQGYLADPSTGAAYVDGIYTLDIRIWDSAASSSGCLWGGKYSVYVKGGYFNIMLGDPNATALTTGTTPTYSNTELWKALWGSSATDTVRYLGVTPYQDANHATISSPTEIAPRQQLLTSPFAFRAQHAQYADEAQTDFTVPGKLTVDGTASFSQSLSLPTGSAIGPVKTSSTTVNLGNGYTTATASNYTSLPKYIYDVGQYLYFYSYYSMVFGSTKGNIVFNTPANYDMIVQGSGTFSSTTPVNKIGGTDVTTVKGSAVSVAGTTSTTVGGTSVTEVKGSYLHFSPTQVGTGSASIVGQGNVLWFLQGNTSGTFYSPVIIRRFFVKIAAGQTTSVANARTAIGTTLYDKYNWVMAPGVTGKDFATYFLDATSGSITVYSSNSTSSERTVLVQLIGYSKCFSDMATVTL